MKDLKEVLFAHCSAAADKAMLGVITAAGLGDEWRAYREHETKTIPVAYFEEKGG